MFFLFFNRCTVEVLLLHESPHLQLWVRLLVHCSVFLLLLKTASSVCPLCLMKCHCAHYRIFHHRSFQDLPYLRSSFLLQVHVRAPFSSRLIFHLFTLLTPCLFLLCRSSSRLGIKVAASSPVFFPCSLVLLAGFRLFSRFAHFCSLPFAFFTC